MPETEIKSLKIIRVRAQILKNIFVCTFLAFCLAISAQADAEQLTKPESLYHQAWSIINDCYFDPTFNGQNWKLWEHRYSEKLKDEEDAHLAIETMVASLGSTNARLLVANEPVQATVDKKEAHHLDQSNGTIASSSEITSFQFAELEKPDSKILGYIRIKSFKSANCLQDLKQAIIQLRFCHGLILDLRGNQNGLIYQAEPAATLLLTDTLNKTRSRAIQPRVDNQYGTRYWPILFSNTDRTGYNIEHCKTSGAIYLKPLVILINHETAGAAVVFAAALKENGRATLVGVRADKGQQLIESVYNLDDGSQLRIDTSRWQTPKNNDFSGVGYPVDVELKLTAADKHAGKGPWWKVATTNPRSGQPNATRDLQLLKAKEVLRDIVIRTANTPVSPVETEFKEGGTLSF